MAEIVHTQTTGVSLTRTEGVELTIALGKAHEGDDYDNADVYGRIKHFGGSGYQAKRFEENPELFKAKINDQIERLSNIIAPAIGKIASAKHCRLGVKRDDGWEIWSRAPGCNEVMHTRGVILGIAAIAMKRRMAFDYFYPDRLDKANDVTWYGGEYKIGVLLDTTDNKSEFAFRVPAPKTDRMLVPVRGFPRQLESFSGLWSWQLSGR